MTATCTAISLNSERCVLSPLHPPPHDDGDRQWHGANEQDHVDLECCHDCMSFITFGSEGLYSFTEDELELFVEEFQDDRISHYVVGDDMGFTVGRTCDTCKSALGGDRWAVTGYLKAEQ